MITESLSTLKIHKLTQAQYERERETGRIDENAIYLTPDEEIDLSPYATVEQLNSKADKNHTHSIDDVTNLQSSLDEKVSTNRTINGKRLTANITLSASDVGAAEASHSHDDIYYTETEIDTKLATKSDTTHNHDSSYDAKGAADDALTSAKSYTDTKTANLASTTTVDTKISTHNTSTSAHNDIRVLISDLTTKLNNFLNVDDTTTDQLSEVLALIENNKGTLESLTTSKVNVSDIVDNLTTSSATKVLSAKQGVAIKSLIDALQTAVDGKALSSHNHDASNITSGTLSSDRLPTVPIAKGGTGATTAAAALTNLGITATATELNTMDGITATTTELNYVDGVTSNIQTQLDAKVPTSRTINGKSLSANITLSASDVNAYTKTEIDNLELVTVNDIDTICGATIQVATASEVTF